MGIVVRWTYREGGREMEILEVRRFEEARAFVR